MSIASVRHRHAVRRFLLASVAIGGSIAILPGSVAHALASPMKELVRTAAIAQVSSDNAADSRLGFDVIRMRGPRIDAENAARATAHCVNCQAVAISFQIVAIAAPTIDLTAANTAEAVNDTCTACQTLAVAYQFIVVTRTPVPLTRADLARLSEIERALNRLRQSTAGMTEIEAQTNAYAAEVLTIVQGIAGRAPSAADSRGKRKPKVTMNHRRHLRPGTGPRRR